MDIYIWEVVKAVPTKPFGYTAFYPGPGLGGHWIPINPFYLIWKAREFEINTKFIELAGEINTFQPLYFVEKSIEALYKVKKSLNGSSVLILGASYKKDIDDMRESPTSKLIEIFSKKSTLVSYNDPYVPKIQKTRNYYYKIDSIDINEEIIGEFDLVVLSTNHSNFDYKMIAENAQLIIDTRNAFVNHNTKNNINKAWSVI